MAPTRSGRSPVTDAYRPMGRLQQTRGETAEQAPAAAQSWRDVFESVVLCPVFTCLFTLSLCDIVTRPLRHPRRVRKSG